MSLILINIVIWDFQFNCVAVYNVFSIPIHINSQRNQIRLLEASHQSHAGSGWMAYINLTDRGMVIDTLIRMMFLILFKPTPSALSSTWIKFNPALVCNHTACKEWDEITYPFPNFNGAAVELWEWISKFILHFVMDMIIYSYGDYNVFAKRSQHNTGPVLQQTSREHAPKLSRERLVHG